MLFWSDSVEAVFVGNYVIIKAKREPSKSKLQKKKRMVFVSVRTKQQIFRTIHHLRNTYLAKLANSCAYSKVCIAAQKGHIKDTQ